MSPKTMDQRIGKGVLLLTATLSLTAAASRPVYAQRPTPPSPSNILVFPAIVDGDRSESTRLVEELVTDAVRNQLTKLGISVLVYSRRLPSIQRAISESDKIITEKDAEAGPGDDSRKAQRFAEVVGATEYLTIFVDGYSYDATTRQAKFNLSVSRYNTQNGMSLGAFARGQQGIAPADVAKDNQRGSAIARASEVGADQASVALFPKSTGSTSVVAVKQSSSRRGSPEKKILAGFGALLGLLYFTTR